MPIIPGPSRPYDVARTYLDERAGAGEPLALWRDDWYTHRGTVWEPVDRRDVRADLVRWLDDAEMLADGRPVPWGPIRDKTITDILALLGDLALRRASEGPTVGMFLADVWLNADMEPREYTPAVWNTSVASYPWDVRADCPRTLAWLSDILSAADVEVLRQWLGYLVSGRTDLQKMLVMIGPPRSGKGTLLWLMEELLGPGSTASVAKLSVFAETFGLESFLGKRLVVMPDVRWTSQHTADAVPEILSITGCDARDVNRKNKTTWHGRLAVRFVAASNDTPSMADASGALAGRMITITMSKSFLGKEDPALRDALREELPGILQWALGGLRELERAGRFVESQESVEAREEMRRSANPLFLFIEDDCVKGPYACVLLDTLYERYESWCRKWGYSRLPAHIVSRQLQNTYRGEITTERVRRPSDGVRVRWLRGVTLRVDPRYSQGPLTGILYPEPPVPDEPVPDPVPDAVPDEYGP